MMSVGKLAGIVGPVLCGMAIPGGILLPGYLSGGNPWAIGLGAGMSVLFVLSYLIALLPLGIEWEAAKVMWKYRHTFLLFEYSPDTLGGIQEAHNHLSSGRKASVAALFGSRRTRKNTIMCSLLKPSGKVPSCGGWLGLTKSISLI